MTYKIFTCSIFFLVNYLYIFGQNPCDTLCKSLKKQENNDFSLATKNIWQSSEMSMNFAQPLVADLDNDNIPEIIVPTTLNSFGFNGINVFNSETGVLKYSFPTTFSFGVTMGRVVMADVNNDGFSEFIIASHDQIGIQSRGKLICLTHMGAIIWISDSSHGQNIPISVNNYDGGTLGVADFNLDGIPEVYINNEIYNAQTGIKLIDGGNNGLGMGYQLAFTSSVAANVDLDNNLELVAGFSVYKVIINNLNGMSGNSMNPINIAVDGRYRDGFTSVADINLDGKLDIIIIAESDKTNVGVYCYTIENNQPVLLAQIGQYTPNTGWQTSGPVSVAYNKAKNRMDLFCSVYGNNLNEIVCFSYNGSQLLEKVWSYPINDVVTLLGITLFDINNDGNIEVLYKDNDSFQIINYENDTPNLVYSYPCGSISYSNYPVIANIDCTDQAKVCVICDGNQLNGVLDSLDALYEAVGFGPSFCTPEPTYNCNLSFGKVPTDVVSFTLPIDGSGNYEFILNSSKLPTLANFDNQLSIGLYSEQPNEDNSCLNLIIADGQSLVETVNDNSINGCFNSVQLTPGKKYWLTIQMIRDSASNYFPNIWNVEIVDLGNGNTIKNNSGVLTVFGAPEGSRWAPARKIWNQFNYNPLFINDDGSVPQFQKNHATYQNGKYNNFMVQESLVDENGFYPVPAASLRTSIDCIDFDSSTGLFTATFQIQNSPSASLTADPSLPISFYLGDPSTSGSLLGTYRTSTSILPGDTIYNLTFSFPYSGSATSLFVLVNTEKPSPFTIDSSAYLIAECDYNDNVFQAILPAFDLRNAGICTGETITFYGDMLTDNGIYYHEISDDSGCDSIIVRLDLEVSQVKNETLNFNACDAYTWNGTTYTSGGTFIYQTLSVNGCDSITTLTLQINQSNNTIIERQACDSIIWNGATYDNSGIHTYMTTNIYGCDSTETLNLTIYPSSQKNINFTTCEAYTWNGQTYAQSGIYTYPSKNIYGCDSITTLNLTIHPTITETIQETQCDTYTWNGTTYTQSGSYDYQTLSVLNCDSIATLALTIHPSSQESISYSSCAPYLWNGTTYTESGTYSYKTQNIFGCDSTTTLDLTILPSSDNTTTQTACDTYTWSGTTYDQSGTYTTTSTNVFGCDSISTLNLTIHPSQNISNTETACASFLWQGTTYDQSGIYTYQTQNTFSCDSTVTLNLTIHPESSTDITTTACDSLIYQGQTITESGFYTFDLQSKNGCDSTINLNLTISADRNENTLSACGTYLWPVTGEAYTQSGTYQAVYTNAQGCDSTYRLDLTIHPEYNQETTAEACAKYLWTINNQTYTQSGQHSVTLRTREGCDSIITLDVTIHPEFEYRDTIITNEPYFWPINNTTYETSGIYTETFSTDVNCDSIHYLYLTIRIDTDIHVPNIISPDGPNSQFTFYGSSISIIQDLSVYDRWGNQVFHRKTFPPNDSTQGWDGKYQGKNLTPGVYTYSAQLILTDGTIISKYGDVTIIR